MADRTIFLDLDDVSGGGDGTEGDPYTSFSEMQTDEDNDLVTNTRNLTINIKGSTTAVGSFTWSGWDTNTSFRIKPIAWPGEEGNGIKTKGAAGGAPYLFNEDTSNHVFILEGNEFYEWEGFEIRQGNAGSSLECFRTLGGVNLTLRKCLLYADSAGAADQDGITSGGHDLDVTCEHCIFDQFDRSGCGACMNGRAGTWTQNWTFDSCLFNEMGVAGENTAGGIVGANGTVSSGTVNFTVKNSGSFNVTGDTDSAAWAEAATGDVTYVWTGNDNCSDDTSTTGQFGSGSNNEDNISLVTADTAGSYRVTDLTTDSEDYTPVEVTTNDKCVNDGGTVLTEDIVGTSRPQGSQDDRGPFELVAAAAGIEIFRRRIEGYK